MYRSLILSRKFMTFSKLNLNSSCALKETFNARPNLNLNFLRKDTGLFGVPQLSSHEGFLELTDKCISKTNSLINEALSLDRNRKMVEIFDELSDSLCQVADLSEFIRFAHPNLKFSQAAETASITISGIVEKLNTNVQLYQVLKKAVLEKDIYPTTQVDDLVGDLFLFDFEQSGIHLPDKERNKVVQLNNIILELGQQFVSEVAKPRIVKESVLPDIAKHFFPGHGGDVTISGLYADSPNVIVREMAYRIFLYPDPNQDLLLLELLTARNDLAKTCGFETYAHRALRGSILETPQNVMNLLNALTDGIKLKASIDFREMAQLKVKQNSHCGDLEVWDVPYFTSKSKQDRFDVTAKEFSPYFSLGSCMEGLNLIFQSLYGISLVNSEIVSGEAWAPDVYKLSVMQENEGLLGYIYCDFYERSNKPSQDCHFTIRGGKSLPDGAYQTPIVALMLNFPLPRWSTPTLLTPGMVDNLFHEMGHAMHSMLARTRYQHVSGTRCSTDFAEVPSILMEYFASDMRVVKLFAKHFQTKQAMPENMLRRLCASKRLFCASETQLQTFYAALDQVYHGRHPLDGDTTEVLKDVQNKYYGLRYIENTAWQLRFSHLVGYGAKYYSYLVSRALANLIWKMYFKEDPLSRVQGQRYRDECLFYGGGKHPGKLVLDFLKVDPTPDILAKSLVEEIDEHQADFSKN